MENNPLKPKMKLHEQHVVCLRTLTLLSKIYSLDPTKFYEVYKLLPEKLIKILDGIPSNTGNDDLDDIFDFWVEVKFYNDSHVHKLKKKRRAEIDKNRYKEFTLRNTEDLTMFSEFLDRMVKLLDLSPGHFIKVVSTCPTAYWDKIDDLRETSFKFKRDSAEYISCLEKCKKISFAFSELSGCSSEEDDY